MGQGYLRMRQGIRGSEAPQSRRAERIRDENVARLSRPASSAAPTMEQFQPPQGPMPKPRLVADDDTQPAGCDHRQPWQRHPDPR